jgi:anti-sigma regulatory factor (Ser/Thr protein kinase)
MGTEGTLVRAEADASLRRRYIQLAAKPESVGAGRQWFRTTIEELNRANGFPPLLPDVEDAMVVCVSEILTNAVLHTRAKVCALMLVRLKPLVYIGVMDDDLENLPKLRKHGNLYSDDGRGLSLVAGLSDRWGHRVYEQLGLKVVWCEFGRSLRYAKLPGTVPGQLQR